MNKGWLKVFVVTAILLCPVWAFGQEARIEFNECAVLSNGVLYYVWVCAGADLVNDMHICVYDVDGNAIDMLSISAPPSWTPHAGGNCGDWSTVENPIYPGECLNEFDFKVPPGYCHILVVWQLTQDGTVVAHGETYLTCASTAVEDYTWSSIKSLYR